MIMRDDVRLKQQYNFLFAKLLLDFTNGALCESLAEASFYWILLLLYVSEQDETSANTAYARLEHLRSSSDLERSRKGGMSHKRSAESELNPKRWTLLEVI